MVHYRKKAYAIYLALLTMRDLLEGVKFTVKTHHSNLTYLNNAGSKKVLNWTLENRNWKTEKGN
jgi:hypothetical protein